MSEQTSPGQELSQKVLVRRWPDAYSLVGDPTTVLDLDQAAFGLAESGFMRAWCASKIKEALLDGTVFQNTKRIGDDRWVGRADGVVSEYKIATKDELISAADSRNNAAFVSGRALSKRAQEKAYELYYDNAVESVYWQLPKQARTILDILEESKRGSFTEAAIEVLLVEAATRLKTKQEPMKIFGFYRQPYLKGGHLKEVEASA